MKDIEKATAEVREHLSKAYPKDTDTQSLTARDRADKLVSMHHQDPQWLIDNLSTIDPVAWDACIRLLKLSNEATDEEPHIQAIAQRITEDTRIKIGLWAAKALSGEIERPKKNSGQSIDAYRDLAVFEAVRIAMRHGFPAYASGGYSEKETAVGIVGSVMNRGPGAVKSIWLRINKQGINF